MYEIHVKNTFVNGFGNQKFYFTFIKDQNP